MTHTSLQLLLFAGFFLVISTAAQPPTNPSGFLAIVNQGDHTLVLFDLDKRQQVAAVTLGINGHELAVSPDAKFAFVPIYGNSGVGRPGTDGQFIDVIDLHTYALAGHIDLGKPVRPHCAKFGPGGLLYVSAELANSVFVVDTHARKVVAEIPTGQSQTHMLVISPDGRRAYTSNVESGTVSVLDLQKRTLVTVIPVAKKIQRITISPDGRQIFTHDQDQPRIAVIDAATNKVARYIALPATVYSSAVTPDGMTLLASAPSGKIFMIDLTQAKLTASIDVPPSAGQLIVSPDGQHAFLSCPQAASIQVLDLSSGKLDNPIALTKGVDGLVWLPML
jgi:YVTN family beta-propeller protein